MIAVKRRPKNVRQVTMMGQRVLGAEEAVAVRLELSNQFRRRQEQQQAQLANSRARIVEVADRSSIRRLVDSVEARLVDALWTLARLPDGGSGGRCGLPYMHDKAEIFANAVAAGDWHRPHMGAPPPKSIDAMHVPLSWLSWLPRELADIVRAGAASKEGNVDANVSWGLVRGQVEAARALTIRTLQRRYEAGLRAIAMQLAIG
jgi:hypothetical protein